MVTCWTGSATVATDGERRRIVICGFNVSISRMTVSTE
jgi:hypothetical protein